MLSLSTAYCVERARHWSDVLKCAQHLGFSSLELSVEIPASWMSDIQRSVETNEVTIRSLHNYCPCLVEVPAGKTIYNAYMLSSTDEQERLKAVSLTISTIEWAARLGASAVVVHSGEVPLEHSGRDLYSYTCNYGRHGRLFENYRQAMLEERAQHAAPYLENLQRSLDALLPVAQRHHIKIGLESRFFYHEIPLIEELEHLLARYPQSPLGYWHDVGHAEMNVRLGLVESQQEYFRRLGSFLIGMHLHDVKKFSDHHAPGSGEIDFSIFTPYLAPHPEILKVIEVHHRSSERAAERMIRHLNSVGIS